VSLLLGDHKRLVGDNCFFSIADTPNVPASQPKLE